MKNSLDDIECIPTYGNLTPPYTIISHPYCVDIISSYFTLSNLEYNDKNEALSLIKENIEYYCKSNNISFAYHFDNKLPLIISPQTNNFQWFLGLQIIGFDINKIKALLTFQQKRYTNDEIDFVTFVEFAVYNIVKYFSIINNSAHLKTIMDWVYQQRTSSVENQKQLHTKLVPQKIISKEIKKKSSVEPSFIIIRLTIDPEYFVNNANQIMEAFKLLKGGGFINNSTKYDYFKCIFSGQKINRLDRIDWTGKQKDLHRFITLLMAKGIIKKIRFKWETTCNCFTINEKDFLPSTIRKSNGKNDNEEKLMDIINQMKVI